ncbi:MAG: hypothetical protein QOD39_1606 [Mycobacterium sp.]|jgi:hypothetical protein|nr:hypothetical protein [Mycobacterium sp.]
MVLSVGRHTLAGNRRKSSEILDSVVAPAAVFLAAGRQKTSEILRRKPSVVAVALLAPAVALIAAGGDIHSVSASDAAKPVVADTRPFGLEIVAAGQLAPSPAPMVGQINMSSATTPMLAASRYRTVDRALPVGLAPERGLQVRTVLASRAITAAFPEIQSIGGVRPDALPWHPNGLALDVMIPNPGTPEGIALGNEIVAYVYRNAARFAMQDCIWRGVYYTPNGAQRGGGYGHFDHVHVTTTGGGYPTGNEIYFR